MDDKPQSSPGFYRLPASLVALVIVVAPALGAQSRVRATAGAAFLKEPGGLRLGNLVNGVQYTTAKAEGQWVQALVEGWILGESTQATKRDGFDLAVTAGEGENIRAAPSGVIIARVVEGTLLSRVSTRGKWVQVRRTGWVARGNLAKPGNEVAAQKPPVVGASAKPAPAKPTQAAPVPVVPPPAPPTPPSKGANQTTIAKPAVDSSLKPTADPGASPNATDRVQLRKGASVTQAQEGVPFASLSSKAEGTVLERSRDWVKIRFDGWVRATDLAGDGNALPAISAAQIHQNPEKYVGQTVAWRLQYLATQKADELRPEMPPGQVYLLTRGPLPETGFVYVMVPAAQADQLKGLQPLDEIVVEGVLRAGKTKYLPTPVVELVKVGNR